MTIDRIEALERHVRGRLVEALAGLGVAEATLALQSPPSPELGDFALPCFPFAKALRKGPAQIAEELARRLEPDGVVAGASADRGFLNVRLAPAALARAALGQALAEGPRFAAGGAEPGLHYVVEYSSPNTNKPLHLGHVRNNVLGLSVCRILEHAGHRVTAFCLVNDRGVHICKTMIAYERWGGGRDPIAEGLKGDHHVGDLYVEFSRRFDDEYRRWLESEAGRARFEAWKAGRRRAEGAAEPTLEDFARAHEDQYFNTESELGGATRELLLLWEAGDAEVRGLWSRMNGWVDEGFDATYRRLGVRFDLVQRESETYLLGREVVEKGLAAGLFHRLEDGAVVCDYDRLGVKGSQTPHKVLLRADGTTVYTTQDLGTALARHDLLRFDRQVYVVGDEQKHHFRVLFALLGLVRPELAEACHHLAYGMVNLPEGKMKSREGKVVDADDLMDQMAELAAAELRSRSESGRAHSVGGEDSAEIARRAEAIAQAAIKFHLLAFAAPSTMTFDPARSIDFLGKTGPYCMNAYARTRSILARAGGAAEPDPEALAALGTDREMAVVRAIAAMPAELRRAGATLDPSKVVDATFEVARAFNQLYTDKEGHPVVGCEDPRLRRARLLLVQSVSAALATGLSLLGIEALEEM